MKLFTKLILSLILVGCFTTIVSGQDIIVKVDGEKIKAKIVEINDTQIKYYEFRDINNLLFTMDRALIKEIRFESGTKYKEEQPGSSDLYYLNDKYNNLKINFGAIGNGHLILTYERAIDPGSSFEGTFKIFGLGTEEFRDRSGFGIYGGYKLKLGNLFKKSNEYRPKHIMHGGYFRPVLGYSYSKTSFTAVSNRLSEKDSYVHFGVELGKQWILRNAVAIDLYLGYQYFGGSFTTNDPNADVFRRSAEIEDGDIWGFENRAFSFGFRLGGLFGTKSIDKKKTR